MADNTQQLADEAEAAVGRLMVRATDYRDTVDMLDDKLSRIRAVIAGRLDLGEDKLAAITAILAEDNEEH